MTTWSLTDKQISILRDVEKIILAEPKRVDMGCWIAKREMIGMGLVYPSIDRYNFPPCGTVACIAGWIAELNPEFTSVIEEIEGILRVKYKTREEGILLTPVTAAEMTLEMPLCDLSELFLGGWLDRIPHPIGTQEYAQFVVGMIENFITYGPDGLK